MKALRLAPSILDRYIIREISTPFFITTAIFTGILFLIRSLKLIDLVVNKNIPVGDILLLFSYIVPRFLEVAIPMSILLGVVVAFGRLSADGELVVIRTTGISLRRLISPVGLFAVCALLASLSIAFWLRPWANFRLGLGMFEIAKMQASSGLTPGVFNDFGQLTIYAESTNESSGRLQNVLIADRSNPSLMRTFIARHGQIVSNADSRTLTLRLYDGSINEGWGLSPKVTYFDINNVNFSPSYLSDDEPTKEGKKAEEMYLQELIRARNNLLQKSDASKEEILQLARYNVELHRRWALPFSSLCVALLAMVLGIHPSRGGRSWGMAANIILGVSAIVVYYLLLALASALGEQNLMPAWIAVWTPNLIFTMLAIWLFRMVGSEKWSAVSQALGDLFTNLGFKLGIIDREHRGINPS